jgi:hypothetical protein
MPPHQARDASFQQAETQRARYAGCTGAHPFVNWSLFRIGAYEHIEKMSLLSGQGNSATLRPRLDRSSEVQLLWLQPISALIDTLLGARHWQPSSVHIDLS